MDCVDGKVVLVTGGTGSFGKSFIKFLLKYSDVKKLIVFSRDELKQSQMKNEMRDERLRFFIGDVRDLSRLHRAFNGVDIVIHAAALKQVPTLEYNPFEAVKTNIIGTQNVIDAAIDKGIEKAILISTDKAANPANLYGSTKLCAEKLFVSGNSYAADKTKFSCVRYGNVIGSRGSVVEVLLKEKKPEKLYITDVRMTRFWITLQQTFQLVLFALEHMVGGEMFIPKVPSMKTVDLLSTLFPDSEQEIIGIRPGEKLHEVLLTNEEHRHAVELDNHFVVLPEHDEIFDLNKFEKYKKIERTRPKDFLYASYTNEHWMTKEELRQIMQDFYGS